MKKGAIIALIVFIVIVVVAVSAILGTMFFILLNKEKPSITASDFKNFMEQKEYTIEDANNQFSQYDYIEQVYLAINKDKTYQVEFYEFSDDTYATGFYNNNKARFEASKGAISAETSVNLKKYSKYTLDSNGKYMVVSRIKNTVIYINANSSYKNEIKAVLNELGY